MLGDFEIADDDGQQIVEVMGDTAGEMADRFHLLRMAQHVLGFAPVPALLDQRQFGFAQLCGRGDRQ